MSWSTRPKLVGEWLAENDYATSLDDLEPSGFASDDNQRECETLVSKIVKGIAKIIPKELGRKIDLLVEKYYTEKRTVLTGRQIMYQIFSPFDINKTQEGAEQTCSTLDNTTTTSSSSIKLGKRCCDPWTKWLMKRCSNICTKDTSEALRS